VRGTLEVRATRINEAMKMAAVQAIAASVPEGQLRADNILPSPLSSATADAVAEAVAAAARASGVARS
jgi:malate dehydrogenase (oxaloacetate-decarboxylating)